MAQVPTPRRPRRGAPLRSEHFTLGLPPTAHDDVGIPQGIVLLMAVPKRQLKRAVDRNTVRRVAREAWRAITRPDVPGAPGGVARVRTLAAAQASAPESALLRLIVRPGNFAELPQGARKRLWRAELDGLFAGARARWGL